MQKTTNYELPQWEANDAVKRGDFNSAMTKLDAALKANADAAASAQSTAIGKASSSAVSSLQSTVSALQTAVAGKGNCKIAWGSYTGDGKYGAEHPTTLTFDFKPALVVVSANSVSYKDSIVLVRGCEYAMGCNGDHVFVSWSGNSVSFYSGVSAITQANSDTYPYVAIGT